MCRLSTKGASLLEVIIALVLFSMAASGLAIAIPMAYDKVDDWRTRMDLASHLEQHLEEIRGYSYKNLSVSDYLANDDANYTCHIVTTYMKEDMDVNGNPTATSIPETGNGLDVTYFDNATLSAAPTVTRVDRTVDFNWGTGSPDPTIGVATFSARWTGYVMPEYSETYTFYTNTDDGVRLWVNNVQIINQWANQAGVREYSGTINLTAGVRYAIRMEYFENTTNTATAQLSWASPSTPRSIIPSRCLFTSDITGGMGNGFCGTYYDNIDFTGTTFSRIDQTINFDWVDGSPDPAIGADTFSARWEGCIEPPFTQSYTFYTTSDDGVRLWVNNILVIDNWTDHAVVENTSAAVPLTAGNKYSIRMEMYENGGQAVAQLRWSSPSMPKSVVPKNRLYSAMGKMTVVTITDNATSMSLQGRVLTFDNTRQIAFDNFESGNWNGGVGWSLGWNHSGSNSYVDGTGIPYMGAEHLRLRRNGWANRTVNMTSCSQANLQFWWMATFSNATDNAVIRINDGTGWQNVFTVAFAQADSMYHYVEVDLSNYNMVNNFQIEVRINGNQNGDLFYVDELKVLG